LRHSTGKMGQAGEKKPGPMSSPGFGAVARGYIWAAACSSSGGIPQRVCLPSLSRICRKSAPFRGQRPFPSHLFRRKAGDRRQGGSPSKAGQPSAGANGAAMDRWFLMSPPLSGGGFLCYRPLWEAWFNGGRYFCWSVPEPEAGWGSRPGQRICAGNSPNTAYRKNASGQDRSQTARR